MLTVLRQRRHPQLRATSTLSAPIEQASPPVIAPSNPQIVYQVVNTGAAISIQCSTDGGKSYTKIATPSTALSPVTFAIFASPLDANHLIADAVGNPPIGAQSCAGYSGQAWPIGGKGARQSFMAVSGYEPCADSHFSADGGQTWSKLRLPSPGVISSPVDLQLPNASLDTPATALFA